MGRLLKRKVIILFSVIVLFSFMSIVVSADTSGDWEYSVVSETDKTIEITEYNGTASNLSIPSQINGYTVTNIGWGAFSYETSLISVKVPSTVKSIGFYAFEDCNSLEEVTILGNVESIRQYTFQYCSSLRTVTLPKSVSYIGSGAFNGCTSLRTINYGGTEDDWYDMDNYDADNMPNVSVYVNHVVKPDKPTNLKAVAKTLDSITVSWNGVANVDGYEVYRFVNGKSVFYKDFDASTTSFLNGGKVPNTTYQYKVRSYVISNGKKLYSYYTDLATCKMPNITKPTNVRATAQSVSEIKVSWSKAPYADGYEVYRFVNGKSVFYKAFDANTTSFVNVGKVANTTYYYKMRSYCIVNGKKVYSYYTDLVTCKTPSSNTSKPDKPTNVQAKAISRDTIKVSWNGVANVDGYEVYRFVNGKSVFYKDFDANTTSFNNAGKVANTYYYYKMRSYRVLNGKRVYSYFTDLVTCKTPGVNLVGTWAVDENKTQANLYYLFGSMYRLNSGIISVKSNNTYSITIGGYSDNDTYSQNGDRVSFKSSSSTISYRYVYDESTKTDYLVMTYYDSYNYQYDYIYFVKEKTLTPTNIKYEDIVDTWNIDIYSTRMAAATEPDFDNLFGGDIGNTTYISKYNYLVLNSDNTYYYLPYENAKLQTGKCSLSNGKLTLTSSTNSKMYFNIEIIHNDIFLRRAVYGVDVYYF